jgi:protocatechuate 3,4-dioxygenase beta subunit
VPTIAAAPTVVPIVAVPACIVRPEATEGPYYVDEDLNRTDIRSDPGTGTVSAGIPLLLTFNVAQVAGSDCTALQGAKVEIWHCDAAGVYSDVTDRGFTSVGQKFLRGYQITDANGQATFTTIYPGWYPGRTVHIHFKVHPTSSSVFTSQLFFDDAFSDQVFTQAPYAAKGQRSTLNSNDGIYNPQLLLAVSKNDQGYAATFEIGMA